MKYLSKIFLFIILFILIIPFCFASDNITMNNDNLAISSDGGLLSTSNIYFDSSVEIDGNGTQMSPYKYLSYSRLSDNSIAHFANGEYELDRAKSVNNLTIIGQSPLNTIIKSESFQLTNQNTLNIISVTLKDLSIFNRGNFNVNNVIFENSDGTYAIERYGNIFGGAIYSTGGTVVISSSTFRNNTATYGGAIYITGSTLRLIDSIFENNYAYKYGGGVASEGNSVLYINNTLFTNCYTLTNAGGAVYSKDSKLNIIKSNFTSCNATFGAAICDLASISNIDSIIASNNIANYQGGAIYKMYGSMALSSFIIASLFITLIINQYLMNRINTKYTSKVKEILIKYDDIIVEANGLPSLKNYYVIKVKNFSEMLDAYNNIGKPINHYQEKNKSTFTIINDKVIYVYVLKDKSQLSVK